MRIKFLIDFGGYKKGQIIDDKHGADAFVSLVKHNVIEILPDESVAETPKTKSANKAKQKAGKK